MSEFKIEVVEIGAIEKHPNADTLGVTRVHNYPCIIKLGQFNSGDKAVYIPVDSIVPTGDSRFSFLGEHSRIKAKKLRGVFSMGLLIPAESSWQVGQSVGDLLKITKYETPIHYKAGGETEPDPGFIPQYTDIEGLRRWADVLVPGEEVVITEKIHGANGRFVWHNGRLWVGSHKEIKKEDDEVLWWKVARKLDLSEKLKQCPGLIFYGEVYGKVQSLKYGLENDFDLAFFDVYDISKGIYANWDNVFVICRGLGLSTVPVLFRGSWSSELAKLAEGVTTLGGNHVREGIVIKPVTESWDDRIGRVVLKLHGEGYLLKV